MARRTTRAVSARVHSAVSGRPGRTGRREAGSRSRCRCAVRRRWLPAPAAPSRRRSAPRRRSRAASNGSRAGRGSLTDVQSTPGSRCAARRDRRRSSTAPGQCGCALARSRPSPWRAPSSHRDRTRCASRCNSPPAADASSAAATRPARPTSTQRSRHRSRARGWCCRSRTAARSAASDRRDRTDPAGSRPASACRTHARCDGRAAGCGSATRR